MGHTLDKIDLKILQILQENGKISNIQLSRQIGLSPAPTLERVKKLEKNGSFISSYHAAVDPGALGLGVTALILVALVRQVDVSRSSFLERIEEISEIVECYRLTGDFDYQLKVVLKDIPSLENFITNKLSKIEVIGRMRTLIVLSKVKNSKVLPVKYS